MREVAAHDRPLVVCPLEFERRLLLRRGLGALAEIQCCGPGGDGVRSWAQRVQCNHRLVILCGVAGGLDPMLAAGEARIIAEVIDAQSNERWRSSAADSAAQQLNLIPAIVAGCLQTVGDPHAKADLFQRTGAQMADIESSVFSREATIRGWRWVIVRGVSDTAVESLPTQVSDWVNHHGRTKPLAVAMTLLRRPLLVPAIVRLGRSSAKAVASLAEILRKIIDIDTSGLSRANH